MIKIMIKGDPEGITELVAALQVRGGKARETERIGAEIFDHAKEVAKAELWDRVFSEYAMRGEPEPPVTDAMRGEPQPPVTDAMYRGPKP